jgi:hypothetical protein
MVGMPPVAVKRAREKPQRRTAGAPLRQLGMSFPSLNADRRRARCRATRRPRGPRRAALAAREHRRDRPLARRRLAGVSLDGDAGLVQRNQCDTARRYCHTRAKEVCSAANRVRVTPGWAVEAGGLLPDQVISLVRPRLEGDLPWLSHDRLKLTRSGLLPNLSGELNNGSKRTFAKSRRSSRARRSGVNRSRQTELELSAP